MARSVNKQDVDGIIRGLKQAGALLQADQVKSLWDELQGYKEREATTMMLHNMEPTN